MLPGFFFLANTLEVYHGLLRGYLRCWNHGPVTVVRCFVSWARPWLFLSLPLMLPVKSVAKALSRLPGSLALLPLHHDLIRQVRGHMQIHSVDSRTYQVAQTYLRDPASPVALDRFQYQVHQDFVAGRVAVLDGWVLSENRTGFAIDRERLYRVIASHSRSLHRVVSP